MGKMCLVEFILRIVFLIYIKMIIKFANKIISPKVTSYTFTLNKGSSNQQPRIDITNPLHAKLPYLNLHPLEVVSRYRDFKWVTINHVCFI